MAAVPIGFVAVQAFLTALLLLPIVKVVSSDPYDVRFRSVFIISVVHVILISITNIFAYYAVAYDQNIGLAGKCMVAGYTIDAILFFFLLARLCGTSLWQTVGAAIQFVYAHALVVFVQVLAVVFLFWDVFVQLADPNVERAPVNPIDRLQEYEDILKGE